MRHLIAFFVLSAVLGFYAGFTLASRAQSREIVCDHPVFEPRTDVYAAMSATCTDGVGGPAVTVTILD